MKKRVDILEERIVCNVNNQDGYLVESFTDLSKAYKFAGDHGDQGQHV